LLVGESFKVTVRGLLGQTPFSYFTAPVAFNWTADSSVIETPDLLARLPACLLATSL
jgi:hypothetical protein